MRQKGTETRYPGVWKVAEGVYRIRAKATHERTQKPRQAERLVEGSAADAAKERAVLVEQLRGGASETRPRLREFVVLWSEAMHSRLSSGSRITYGSQIAHILPELGDFYLDTIRATDVQKWVNGLARRLAPTTVRAVFSRLRGIMGDAVAQLDLPRDPCLRVILPAGAAAKKRPMTVEELRAFLAAAKRRGPLVHAAIACLAFTGIRKCHVLALKWEDIDEEAGVIRFRRRVYRGNVSDVTRKKYVPAEYPLNPELARILRAARPKIGAAEGWIFPGKKKLPLSASWLALRFDELAEEVAVQGASPHGLRYTWKDLAREARVDHVVAKALTGHSRDEMHERYSTVRPVEASAAVARVFKLVKGGNR